MSRQIQPQQTAQGKLTGAALDNTACLFLPYADDAFGMRRRPLELDAMKMAFELARMAYTLDIEPWMRAGWTDVSIQVDNQLTTGLKAKETDSFADRVQAMIGSLKVTRAKLALLEFNPFSRMTGALRQRAESDTLKAVVMIHPAAEGRYVVAIGFMGTGARFYDWFSNLRLSTEDGFHKGFYQLTQAFLKNETEILFPDTAEALGLETLTLADIVREMQTDNSRFSLWMAGHSQGAAVMQVYCDHLLREAGVRNQHVSGCGFASPTVAVGDTAPGSAAYPLYHIINDDDLVPRMGSMKHFGLCLRYAPDAAFRDAAYGWCQDADDRRERRQAERLALYVTDTPSMLMTLSVLLELVCQEKTDEAIFGISERLQALLPLDKVVSFAGKKSKTQLENMIAYFRKAYSELMGHAMDTHTLEHMREAFRPIVRSASLKTLLGAMFDRFYPPHSLCGHTGNGAYMQIVNNHSQTLRPFVWADGAGYPPRKQYARGYYRFQTLPPAKPAAPPRPRTSPRRRAIHVRR
ncbi:MAG TPA: hypothetical protein PK537_00900 [Candidatus Limiplasma sp.]|mgnify:CR=1 FL=1|nr:hypothetical protein [Candidatus Limiplasma sp.]